MAVELSEWVMVGQLVTAACFVVAAVVVVIVGAKQLVR